MNRPLTASSRSLAGIFLEIGPGFSTVWKHLTFLQNIISIVFSFFNSSGHSPVSILLSREIPGPLFLSSFPLQYVHISLPNAVQRVFGVDHRLVTVVSVMLLIDTSTLKCSHSVHHTYLCFYFLSSSTHGPFANIIL